MRPEVRDFVRTLGLGGFGLCGEECIVVEIGSLQVPGQEGFADMRPFFCDGCVYFGVDMRDGTGVDMVADAEEGIPLDDGYADVLLCLDTLEHVRRPWKVFAECARLLDKQYGVAIFTTVFNFQVHDFPNDYWRMTGECMRAMFDDFFPGYNQIVSEAGKNPKPHTVVGAVFKQDLSNSALSRLRGDLYEWQMKWVKGSHEE